MAKKNVVVTAKRKAAIASGVINDGTGRLFVNNRSIDAYTDKLFKLVSVEPFEIAGDLHKKYDIFVKISGGGVMARAHAIRSVVAKSLSRKEKSLKKKFLEYDRTMLIDDIRKTEPQKPYRSAARALKQTSYR